MKRVCTLILFLFSWNLSARSADDNLSWKMAEARRAQVKSVDYTLFLEINKASDEIRGKLSIATELNHLNNDLTIDSLVKKIDSVEVNGKKLTKLPLRKGSFDIPKSYLANHMKIDISYTAEYSKELNGFKKNIDPADGEEYLYSFFEPYYAHWLFPCFDQPDLKAKFTLTVKAPLQWKVIHNEMMESEETIGDAKITKFKTTPLISTYLFALASGPYHEWKDQHKKTPLLIYTRKSLEKRAEVKNLFETTKRGLDFFSSYFDHAYPYSKYAVVFVPELAANALESPGAVIVHEQNLPQGLVTTSTMLTNENVLLHEMAHMWFGNLVTMHWWNDLWLKESFATYAATLAFEREFKSDFSSIDLLETKSWGLWQEQLSTAHPIETDVPDIRTSKGIFDGITYGKGAAAIKQLHFFVGEDGFKKGIQDYFKRYGLKNAGRKEFIDSISKSSGQNLDSWSEKWIQTTGVNKVKVNFACERDVISEATISQKESRSNTLSPHRIRLGLYKLGTTQFTLFHKIDVTYEKAETAIPELNGVACPDFVLPNLDDQDFALFGLDKSSLRHAAKALTQLPDPLSRYQLWLILMQMVRDQEMTPKAFMEMALEALQTENDEFILGFLINRHSTQRNFRQQYFQYLTIAQRAAMAPNLEKILWQRVLNSKPRTAQKLLFFDFYIMIAQTKLAQERLFEMITKGSTPEGVPMDPVRRWKLITTVATNGHPGAQNLIESESKRNPSTFSRCMTIAAKSSLPDLTAKKEILSLLFKRNLSQCEYREATYVFHNANYPEISKAFSNDYFKEVTSMNWRSHDDLADHYFANLLPVILCTSDFEKISLKKLNAAKNLTSISRRAWQQSHDELSRCVKVRAMK